MEQNLLENKQFFIENSIEEDRQYYEFKRKSFTEQGKETISLQIQNVSNRVKYHMLEGK